MAEKHQDPHAAQHAAPFEPTKPDAKAMASQPPAELAAFQPPMLLEQDPSGLWMYSRPAWVGGPAVEKNGVPPSINTREAAERVVNNIYPGAFPERVTEEKAPERNAPFEKAPERK